jgi:DNA-binding CsgD family transcriptional regulator
MVQLRSLSLQEFSEATAMIHDAALDSARWPDALALLGRHFRASLMSLWTEDASQMFHDIGGTYNSITHDYVERFSRLDMVHAALARQRVGSVITDGMVLPRSDLERTEFYNDFADHHGIQYCMEGRVTDQAQGADIFLTVVRSHNAASFDEDEVNLLQLLIPHIRGALVTAGRLKASGLQRDSAISAFDTMSQGVLLLDSERSILHANPRAEKILEAADGLTTLHGRLHAMHATNDAALRQAFVACGRKGGATLAIERPSGRAPLVVTLQPLGANTDALLAPSERRATTLVFVVGAEAAAPPAVKRVLQSAYGLTDAEASVAEVIARGSGTKEAALELNIAPSTLRWHLRRVFEKTRTERQAELAHLVSRLEF